MERDLNVSNLCQKRLKSIRKGGFRGVADSFSRGSLAGKKSVGNQWKYREIREKLGKIREIREIWGNLGKHWKILDKNGEKRGKWEKRGN